MKKCDIKLQISIQNLLKYTGHKVAVAYMQRNLKNGEFERSLKKRKFDNK